MALQQLVASFVTFLEDGLRFLQLTLTSALS
ncbi:hypothetical protein LINPERPRIM_LOCUS5566 [Linum perenne]